MEKIFENSVYRRLSFANETIDKTDKSNGGFLPGYRTADNIYGSDVWGINSKLWGDTDTVFLQYARCILRVKANKVM